MLRSLLSLLLLAVLAGSVQAQPDPRYLGKTIEEWTNQLRAADPGPRRNAAFVLGKMGNRAAAALPVLKNTLRQESNARTREALVVALGEIASTSLQGGGDGDLERLLLETARDDDKLVRRSAVHALGRLESHTDPVHAALVQALADPAPEVRQNAAWALGSFGEEVVSELRRVLSDADSLVKRDAAGSLSRIAQDKPEVVRPALEELIEVCKDSHSETRKSGLIALIKIVGPKDLLAVPMLKESLRDDDHEIRSYAALALSNIGGPEAAAAVPVLLETLRRGEPELQRASAIALHNIGPNAAAAVGDLVKALDTPDPELRRFAALALGGIGPKADRAISRLADLMVSSEESLEMRIEAAEALTRMGDSPALRPEVPRILKLLGDPSQHGMLRVRLAWIFNSLIGHAPSLEAAYPVFERVCAEPGNQENGSARYHCAFLLGVLRKSQAPEAALNVLGEWLHDSTGRLYFSKQSTVGATGQEASGQATVNVVLQGDSRVMAVQALGQIGTSRLRARPDIMRQLELLANDSELDPMLRKEVQQLRQGLK